MYTHGWHIHNEIVVVLIKLCSLCMKTVIRNKNQGLRLTLWGVETLTPPVYIPFSAFSLAWHFFTVAPSKRETWHLPSNDPRDVLLKSRHLISLPYILNNQDLEHNEW